jgi:hypothetical protein
MVEIITMPSNVDIALACVTASVSVDCLGTLEATVAG